MVTSNALRQQRYRRHARNDHTLCNPDRCPNASPTVTIAPVEDPPEPKPVTQGKPTTKRYQSEGEKLTEAMASGDQRRQLTALRDYLARRLDEPWTHGRDAAPLAQRLADVITKLAELPDPTGESEIDELERARRERRARAGKAAGQ
jgi:hypothetical protein